MLIGQEVSGDEAVPLCIEASGGGFTDGDLARWVYFTFFGSLFESMSFAVQNCV